MATTYDAHKANYRSVSSALKQVERAVTDAIRRGDSPATKALTLTQMLLVAVKAEARLQRLMHTPGWLTDDQRDYISKAKTRLEMWERLIETGFRQRYGKKKRTIPVGDQLDHDAAARYRTLMDILDQDLRGIIELRNKLAHGQWVYGLTEAGQISTELTKLLKKTNTLELRFRDSIAEDMASAVANLLNPGVSFDRSFNAIYRKIKSSHDHLLTDNFDEYVRSLKATKRNVSVTWTVPSPKGTG